jgi:hypothetical protein
MTSQPSSLSPGWIVLSIESGNKRREVFFAIPNLPGPRWLEPSIRRAATLLSLPQNWDHQGAPPIDHKTVQIALDSLSLFMCPNGSLPQWTPTQRAGVQLDWHENGVDLEIAFEPGEPAGYAVFSDLETPENEWDGPVEKHLDRLRGIFESRLTS